MEKEPNDLEVYRVVLPDRSVFICLLLSILGNSLQVQFLLTDAPYYHLTKKPYVTSLLSSILHVLY